MCNALIQNWLPYERLKKFFDNRTEFGLMQLQKKTNYAWKRPFESVTICGGCGFIDFFISMLNSCTYVQGNQIDWLFKAPSRNLTKEAV